MMDIKVSRDKHISRWVDHGNHIYVRWKNRKLCMKTKNIIDRGKRSKTLGEVKPVESISKNLQSFLRKSFLHINCKTMHMSSRILSDWRKIKPHRKIPRINWVIQVCLTQSKNVRKVWFKERITINKIWTKVLNGHKATF